MHPNQNNIKPITIALFLVATLLVLLALTLFSQEGAIEKPNKSEDGFVYKDLSIKYPTLAGFLKEAEDSVATVEQVKSVTTAVVPLEENLDSSVAEVPTKKVDFSKIDTTQIVRIRYPDSTGVFLNDIKDRLTSGACRMLHYGDSQIEGDRISSYLRNRLQGMYGGHGPGFIPIKQVYSQISAEVTPSDNWTRHALFDPTQKKLPHKKYGTYMSLSRFTPHVDSLPDSTTLDSLPIQKATISIGKTTLSYFRLRKFKTIGLHYGNCLHPIGIKIFENDVLIQSDSLIADANYHQYNLAVAQPPDNIRIELEGKISADFYGLTLDGNGGVQIDNIAMRGASGTIFTKSDAANYQRMANVLNPKVVILQYGGNTVPYLKDSTDVDNYGRYIASQMRWLKRRIENVRLFFIGPTDMVTSINGSMESYPLLPYLNKTLMETCLSNNAAYWNMYEAMGGKGSMKIWVDEKLVGSDYTHFTHSGTKIISELFFIALYLDLKEE